VQIGVIRTTPSFVVFLLAILLVAGSAALAEESLRIARPSTGTTGTTGTTATSTEQPATSQVSKPCCGSTACGADCTDLPQIKGLSSSLPADGLFARWRAEFVNPTMCPILLCHGSCAGSSMSCKNIKTMIDSLLDAYIPEEPPVQAILNFRCCAGFTED
jgi:hypothetical protein